MKQLAQGARRVSTMLGIAALAVSALAACDPPEGDREPNGRWTVSAANRWYDAQPWLVGANFVPSTAVNELEMWQADTFDPDTIDRELALAEGLGFNVMRVFLHDLLWEQDADGFKQRIEQYLAIADRHGMRTMLVLFDNVWGPDPQLGPQPAPIPGVHNSRWVQSPSADETRGFPDSPQTQQRLEGYVKGIISAFADDPRVIMWDLVNEPGNSGIQLAALPLVDASFAWAREVAPSQPLTAGVWIVHTTWEASTALLAQADVITFHAYSDITGTADVIDDLREVSDRPLICTEYMARTLGSRFETHLPLFRDERVGAIHWGLVSGKTQTIYPWISDEGAPEPEIWFHDVFRPDGTPFDAAETELVMSIVTATNP